MSLRGLVVGNSGDHSVSSAPSRESDKQKRLDRPAASNSFTRSGDRKTSKVWSASREYWVYIHRAADGSVLYVGYTSDRKGRERAHRNYAAWFSLIAETVYSGPYDRARAQVLERKLIERHDPPHNFMHTSRYVHKRWQKAVAS